MADKTATTYELKFEWLFQDGDTRVFTMKNPKSTITSEEIQAIEAMIIDSPQGQTLLIGDKAGALFRRINTVVRETQSVTTLDLSHPDK